MSTPFFSVIIPTYNRASLLKEALDSVFSQTFSDYEVIVVDDGSTDETLEILKSYGDKIQALTQKNSGPGAARNLGAEIAKGEYLAFLDSDDVWLPWALETASSAIIESDFPAMLILKHQDFNQYQDLIKIKEKAIIKPHIDFFGASKREGYSILSCSTTVIKNKDFQCAGGFSAKKINAEDLDLWMKLSNSKGFVEILSPVCCGYRRHSESAVANLEQTHLGLEHMIRSEQSGGYPGGKEMERHRRIVITRYTRPASLALLKYGKKHLAMDLYQKTFLWNLHEARFKYILGFIFILSKHIIFGKKQYHEK